MSTSKTQALSDSERLAWLRLIRSESIGPITFRQLLNRFGSASAALQALPELARHGGRRRSINVYPLAQAEAELEALTRFGGRLRGLTEPDYPQALAALDDAPPLLTLLGDPGLAQKPAVAIVGARNASGNGRRLARSLAADLGKAGVVVVSGLARGIDATAHEAALESGTIAAVAGGLDVVYPPENEPLYRAIVERGLLISEMAPGTVPQARHFPRRNRLISGLSLAVVVVEAALKSGSLITARYAGEQGRDVCAVPGSPLDPRARGCNKLLRDGATLVESADDVLEAIHRMVRPTLAEASEGDLFSQAEPPPIGRELDEGRQTIKEFLSPTPLAVDELIRECHLSPAVVMTLLLELELGGQIERHPGNRVALLMNQQT